LKNRGKSEYAEVAMKNALVGLLYELNQKCFFLKKNINVAVNLNESEYKCLNSLVTQKNYNCRKFAESLNLSQSRASRIIQSMKKKGLLTARRDAINRRNIVIKLTPKSAVLQKKIREMQLECEKKLRDRISQSEIIEIEKNLKKLIDALK